MRKDVLHGLRAGWFKAFWCYWAGDPKASFCHLSHLSPLPVIGSRMTGWLHQGSLLHRQLEHNILHRSYFEDEHTISSDFFAFFSLPTKLQLLLTRLSASCRHLCVNERQSGSCTVCASADSSTNHNFTTDWLWGILGKFRFHQWPGIPIGGTSAQPQGGNKPPLLWCGATHRDRVSTALTISRWLETD